MTDETSLEAIRLTIRELHKVQTFDLNKVVAEAVAAVAHASAMPPADVPMDLWSSCDDLVLAYREIKKAGMIVRLFLLEVDPPKEPGPSKKAGPSKEEGPSEDEVVSKDGPQAEKEVHAKAEPKPEDQPKE